MGIFEKVLQERHGDTLTLTAAEAFAAITVGAVAADGTITPNEAARLNDVFASTRLFRSADGTSSAPSVGHIVELMELFGVDTVIGEAAQVLPAALHPAAFAVAVDLVLVDGQADVGERKYLDRLQDLLHVPDEAAIKMIEVLLVKNGA